jgi:hypothetical protein
VKAPFANDRDYYYVQTNNPTEEILRKLDAELSAKLKAGGMTDEQIKPYLIQRLQSCGPTASVNCQAALGKIVDDGKSQPEERLFDAFNDPRNYPLFARTPLEDGKTLIDPANVLGNRVAAWYPAAVKLVFGNPCEFVNGLMPWLDLLDKLEEGKTVQICLINPGHYISLVCFDSLNGVLLNDPWPGRWPDGNGFNRPLGRAEYEANVKPFALIYS